jgi:hypothetical protein
VGGEGKRKRREESGDRDKGKEEKEGGVQVLGRDGERVRVEIDSCLGKELHFWKKIKL